MKLLFQDSNDDERVVADVKSFAEAVDKMDEFMEERKFKSYYKRLWDDGESRLFVDVGSHTEFFVVTPCSLNSVYAEQEGWNKED